jgi:cytochrome c
MRAFICASLLGVFASASIAENSDATRAYALAGEKGCFECHTLSYGYIGPSFRALAERYRLDPAARAQLPGIVRAGSRGHWGERFAMQPQIHLTDEQVKVLADWMLSQ